MNKSRLNHLLLDALTEDAPLNIGSQLLAANTSQLLNCWAVVGWYSVVSPLVDDRMALEAERLGKGYDAACFFNGLVDGGQFCGHG